METTKELEEKGAPDDRIGVRHKWDRVPPRHHYPVYPADLLMRITRAKDQAQLAGHKAWYLGHSSVLDSDAYQVYSSTNPHGQPYLVRVMAHYQEGSFCYAEGAQGPLVWVICECKAAEHGAPCRHSAAVYMRLERESGLRRGSRD